MENRASSPVDRLTGGCLCGSIRYAVRFSESLPFPPVSSTCQCTMCRKWTASLVAQFIVIRPEQIYPPLDSNTEYKEYMSSRNRFRGFCSDCGSPLIWRSDDDQSTVDLYIGTLDEVWLTGHMLTDGAEIANSLAKPNGTQFWMENAIPGVTDLVAGGRRYQQEGPDGLRPG